MSQEVAMIFIGCFLFIGMAALYFIYDNNRILKENKKLRRKLHRYEYRESEERNDKWKKDFEAIMQKI